MTDKRFVKTHKTINWWAVLDNGEELLEDEVVELLNELHEENEQLKSDNFNLNKSVEYLDETVKEQCTKLDWASECGVKWGKEFKQWNGDLE